MSPDAYLVYGFEFEYDYQKYQHLIDEEEDEEFGYLLYEFLEKRGISYCKGGLSGHYDEEFGVIGFEKNLTAFSYVASVNLDTLKSFEDQAKKTFTPQLLQEIMDFLKIKKAPMLKTYIVANYG